MEKFETFILPSQLLFGNKIHLKLDRHRLWTNQNCGNKNSPSKMDLILRDFMWQLS